MQYTVVYDDVAISAISKKKTITTETYVTEDVNAFDEMCATIDEVLKGRDGLIKVVRPIIENGVLCGISYRYQERSKTN